MNSAASQNYIEGLKSYHKKLEVLLQQSYGITTEYLEVLSWGYHTTAIYVKSTNHQDYLLKLASWSEEKEHGILKDLELSRTLHSTIPTPVYLKTLGGSYICRFEDKVLRLAHYISGLAPLMMNFNVLGQMVEVLKKIHASEPPNALGQVLLHGDLTPHNVLVSFDQLVAVMDFELACVGSREWDLARTAVFSWNYLPGTPFYQVAQFVLEHYAYSSINSELIYQYALENAQNHLTAVEKHRQVYKQEAAWIQDHTFAKNQLAALLAM